MALWDSSGINSTETAMVFNQLWNRKSIAMVRKKNGLLYAILGKEENGSTPGAGPSFPGEKKIPGHQIEVKLLGKLKTITAVADGVATEGATATLTNSADYWGASVFDLAHYKDAHGLPESEIMRYAGDELKTANYLDEVFNMLTLSFENSIASASSTYGGIHDTKAPARTVMGGWQYAVSDGSTSGESSYNTYGTLSRTANTDYASYVNGATGDLTLNKIQTVQNNVIAAGGTPSVGVAHTTPYTKIQTLAQGYTLKTYEEDWSKFGGTWVEFAGIKFILDQRAPAAVVGILDPTSWVFYRRDINFTNSGVVLDPSRVASYVLNWGAWTQLICVRPSSNGKLTGITS